VAQARAEQLPRHRVAPGRLAVALAQGGGDQHAGERQGHRQAQGEELNAQRPAPRGRA